MDLGRHWDRLRHLPVLHHDVEPPDPRGEDGSGRDVDAVDYLDLD